MWQIEAVIFALDILLDSGTLTTPEKLWRIVKMLDRRFAEVDKIISDIKKMLSMF